MLDLNAFKGLLVIVYLVGMLIARSRRPHLPVWSIMAFAMFMVLALGLAPVDDISSIVSLDVLLFLIGMFSIVAILDYSGVLDAIAAWFIVKFRTRYSILIALSLIYGILSAFTVNDALTLMGVPIAVTISRAIGADLTMIILLTAFSITIGSVMTPVGNPQNMLISSLSGIPSPFLVFLKKLTIPTILNLIVTSLLLIKMFKVKNKKIGLGLVPGEMIKDKREAILGISCYLITITIFIINDVLEAYSLPHISRRGFIPFMVSAVTYMFSKHPRKILQKVSWGTIVFFITMFVTMEGIWRSGILSLALHIILPNKIDELDGIFRIAIASIVFSQFLSNVPFTKLFISYMSSLGYTHVDVNAWVTLSMAATIAGNLTILGAASNIIMLEVVEEKRRKSISFMEFFKVGTPITIINTILYIPFICLIK
ncbi:MAG: SLC13 family permease [Ignisphaera sp.]|uniref:Anion transporter n=1 Tax=Ignisphaera aggregans TaxID=334771 RepID=A0A7C4JIV0_9CREN